MKIMTKEEAIQILSTRDAHGVLCGYTSGVTEALHLAIEALQDRPNGDWIPCSERVPKENEYVDNVCKYYLIQDEYVDMHVAHLSGRGWETIESIKALGCDVIAWMPLPKPYKGGDSE